MKKTNSNFKSTVWKTFMLFLVLFLFYSSCSEPFVNEYPKSFNVLLENKTDLNRVDELITLNVPGIQKNYPDFNSQAFIVLRNNQELPSQVNTSINNGKNDQVLFHTNINGNEQQRVIIRYNPEGKKERSYTKRTQAELSHKFGGKFVNHVYEGGTFKNVDQLHVPPEHTDHSWFIRYEGPGWESDKVGYRFYLDWRNATDIYGKKTHEMVLQKVGLDGFDSYHEMSSWGMDILKVGESLGIGSMGMWHHNKAERVAKTDSVYCQISSNGPIQSSVRTIYYGWQVEDFKTDLTVDLSINAGSRLTLCELYLEQQPMNICTGIVKHDSANVIKSGNSNGWQYLATYGKQSLASDSLGMAVFYNQNDFLELAEDEYSHVIVLQPVQGKLKYYFLAAWEKELDGLVNQTEFENHLNETVTRLNSKIDIVID